MYFSRIDSGTVLHRMCTLLTHAEVRSFLTHAFRRRIRKRGTIESLFDRFRLQPNAVVQYSWNFVSRIGTRDDHWATINIAQSAEGYALSVVGPQAEEVVERVNRMALKSLSSSERSTRRRSHRPSRRASRREKKRIRREIARAARMQPRSSQRKRNFVPAPRSALRYETLTPQFRKSKVFWSEALTAVVAIFEVRGNAKRTARQKVALELRTSLEQNGYRFAQFKRYGFSLRFDLVDGRWRGDITPLTISCTKQTDHPLYRRMREYVAGLVIGQSAEVQKQRRKLMMNSFKLVA